jgi:recombination protein RecT
MATDLAIIDPKTIGSELQKYKTQMEAALPKHMTADRMARIALTSLRVNPKLMNCTRESFFGSMMAASQLGFEPGINGQCYLIPYGNVCTLVPGWRGYLDLVSRTERASAWTEAVYDGDEFEYTLGTNPQIHHKRGKWAGKEAALQYVYAVGRIKNNDFPIIDVWDIDKVWAHRSKQNKVGDRHYSFAHPEMYARKIPLLQVIKYLPSSIEIASASALDITASEGRQNLTIDMALNKDFESGGDSSAFNVNDPAEQELEDLFDKLGKNPSERKALRESYIPRGARQELVNSLKNKLAPTITITTQADPPKEQASANTEQAKTESAQETEQKRGRGRPRKVDTVQEVSSQQGSQASTQSETQAQPVQTVQESEPTQTGEKFSF